MRIAIVHDWLTGMAGGEQVVKQLLQLYPEADVFTTVDFMPVADRTFLDGHRITTSFIQRLPFARTRYRGYLPLMPLAIEQLDVTGYDVVVSSTSSVAKGVITGPDQLHVAYVHSPMRYAWDLQHVYLREARLTKGIRGMLARLILHYMRLWDSRTAPGVDRFVANSRFIARRIGKAYGRPADVIYPPVDTDRFTPTMVKEDFYVTASRFVPYKRIPLIVEAFRAMPDKKLVVIGDGPEMPAVRAAAGPNVTLAGRLDDEGLRDHLGRAKAFVFAAEEDFGILPVEAQACGTPVIAYAKGGVLESIRGHDDASPRTGYFFGNQTVDALVACIEAVDDKLAAINPADCRANADRFSAARFRARMRDYIDEALAELDAAR